MSTIRRPIVPGVVLLVCALAGLSKEAQTPAKEDNLYSVALFASLSEMEKCCGHIDDSNGGTTIRTDYKHMPVEKDPEITDGLPSQQGNFRVEYLDDRELRDRYKKLRKEFAILRIHPMQGDGSVLNVRVSVSYLTYEKRRFLYAVSDWADVEFRYDCKNQKFAVSGVKLGGI